MKLLICVLVLAMAVPEAVKLKYRQGAQAFSEGRFAEAVEAWHQIFTDRQNGLPVASRVKLARMIAIGHFKQGNLGDAHNWIERAYKRMPEDLRIKNARAVINAAWDELQRTVLHPSPPASPSPSPPATPGEAPPPTAAEARRAFDAGEQLHREGVALIDTASDASEPDAKFSAAIPKLEVAIRGAYRKERALFLCGSSHLLRNADAEDLKAARAQFEEAMKLGGEDRETLVKLSQTCSLQDDIPGAIANLEKALAMDKDCAECHFLLALAYDKSGRDDAPRKTFEHAKAAIGLKSSYKARFQNVLRNSVVAKMIADLVIKIVNDSEGDVLDDKKIDDYAKKFQDMMGSPPPPELRDKFKGKSPKDILQSQELQELKRKFVPDGNAPASPAH